MRRNRFQKIVCRECGASRFVLPKDVYPPPRERPIIIDAPPPELPVLNPIKAPPAKKGSKAAATATKPVKLNPKTARDAAPEFFVVPARGKLITPFRAVALGIAVVALGTGWFAVNAVRRDKASTALRETTDAAWEAVGNGDWAKAHEQFTLAVDASGVLGRRDRAARRLESGLRESTALEQLCPKSLLEILNEADSMSADADKWKRQFNTHFEGRWMVFDGPVALKNDGWQLSYPVKIGKKKRPVRVTMKSSGLDGIKDSDAERGVILAARLTGCQLSEDKKSWKVSFEPESAFLWSLPETFKALGIDGGEFRPADQTEELLAKQAERNGISRETGQ